ncbi:uncharacterized protein PITG_16277 [Phytophthora infestans T30-4]|uniref:Transmembrane protein n=1 Tax=Phytophthora infestans (strain T30-4) TaxID=403677 RepID=D0NTI6_PHYIT|nr:uncharacterized protein PITG_16277 [Phytophthora infestans T30-4]EEY64937.1 conserved hypothetical protein [Phytophthora infestans T30-4]|eukprot:XP_002897667.1 conserved hypothetical protein [Phytophthora infestans T30-4]
MKSQQPSKSSTTFIYSNRLECGDGVDHNGITVSDWSNGFYNCCDDIIPNGFMAFICPVITVAQITVRLGLANYAFILGMHVALYLLGLVAAAAGNPVLLLFNNQASLKLHHAYISFCHPMVFRWVLRKCHPIANVNEENAMQPSTLFAIILIPKSITASFSDPLRRTPETTSKKYDDRRVDSAFATDFVVKVARLFKDTY